MPPFCVWGLSHERDSVTTRSDIMAADGSALGRAPLISLSEAGTLTNAIRTIQSLGTVPLAANLEALKARLTAPQLGPWHCASCGLSGASYSHRDACFSHAEQRPDCPHEPIDGPPVIHNASDEMTELLMRADEDTALAEHTFLKLDVLVTEALDRRGVGSYQVGVAVSC